MSKGFVRSEKVYKIDPQKVHLRYREILNENPKFNLIFSVDRLRDLERNINALKKPECYPIKGDVSITQTLAALNDIKSFKEKKLCELVLNNYTSTFFKGIGSLLQKKEKKERSERSERYKHKLSCSPSYAKGGDQQRKMKKAFWECSMVEYCNQNKITNPEDIQPQECWEYINNKIKSASERLKQNNDFFEMLREENYYYEWDFQSCDSDASNVDSIKKQWKKDGCMIEDGILYSLKKTISE